MPVYTPASVFQQLYDEACRFGDLEKLRRLFAVDPAATSKLNAFNGFCLAAENGHQPICMLLIAHATLRIENADTLLDALAASFPMHSTEVSLQLFTLFPELVSQITHDVERLETLFSASALANNFDFFQLFWQTFVPEPTQLPREDYLGLLLQAARAAASTAATETLDWVLEQLRLIGRHTLTTEDLKNDRAQLLFDASKSPTTGAIQRVVQFFDALQAPIDLCQSKLLYNAATRQWILEEASRRRTPISLAEKYTDLLLTASLRKDRGFLRWLFEDAWKHAANKQPVALCPVHATQSWPGFESMVEKRQFRMLQYCFTVGVKYHAFLQQNLAAAKAATLQTALSSLELPVVQATTTALDCFPGSAPFTEAVLAFLPKIRQAIEDRRTPHSKTRGLQEYLSQTLFGQTGLTFAKMEESAVQEPPSSGEQLCRLLTKLQLPPGQWKKYCCSRTVRLSAEAGLLATEKDLLTALKSSALSETPGSRRRF